MKNRRKFYQDPWEALDGYAPPSEVTLRNLPIFIVVILLVGLLGWYVGKHPRVQEFIKKHSETQQEGTLKPSLLRSEPTAEAIAWGAMPTDTPLARHRDFIHSQQRDAHFRIHHPNATVKRFVLEDEDSE